MMKLPVKELAKARLSDVGKADNPEAVAAETKKVLKELGRTEEEDKKIEKEYDEMMAKAKKTTKADIKAPPKKTGQKKAKSKPEPEKHPGGRPLKNETPRKIVSLRLPEETLQKIIRIKADMMIKTGQDLSTSDAIIKLVSDYYDNM